MADEFRGDALPMDEGGFTQATEQLRVGAPELWAILMVETRGCGFLSNRRPVILFERHIFNKETKGQFDVSSPDISNPSWGGYGQGGAAQYDRLSRAIALDRKAALRSTSWGLGQVMGFNAETAGYTDVEEMVKAMTFSENEHLKALTGEIIHNKLDAALRTRNWANFARGYNGPAYAENKYDTRLASAYQKLVQGPLPDLTVRAAQIYLLYLGYNPGPVDGVPGRFTYSALNEFQQSNNLPIKNEINPDILASLEAKALI
jgi:hypothetical protein